MVVDETHEMAFREMQGSLQVNQLLSSANHQPRSGYGLVWPIGVA